MVVEAKRMAASCRRFTSDPETNSISMGRPRSCTLKETLTVPSSPSAIDEERERFWIAVRHVATTRLQDLHDAISPGPGWQRSRIGKKRVLRWLEFVKDVTAQEAAARTAHRQEPLQSQLIARNLLEVRQAVVRRMVPANILANQVIDGLGWMTFLSDAIYSPLSFLRAAGLP
jgi:hypothetical protein